MDAERGHEPGGAPLVHAPGDDVEHRGTRGDQEQQGRGHEDAEAPPFRQGDHARPGAYRRLMPGTLRSASFSRKSACSRMTVRGTMVLPSGVMMIVFEDDGTARLRRLGSPCTAAVAERDRRAGPVRRRARRGLGRRATVWASADGRPARTPSIKRRSEELDCSADAESRSCSNLPCAWVELTLRSLAPGDGAPGGRSWLARYSTSSTGADRSSRDGQPSRHLASGGILGR